MMRYTPINNFTKKRFTISLILSVIVITGLGTLLLSFSQSLNQFNQHISNNIHYFTVFRLLFIAAIIYFYPRILDHFYKDKPDIDPSKLKKYSYRCYPLIFFTMAELAIAQGGLAWLINTIIQGI